MVHIGQLIRQELKEQGRSVTWLAKNLNCSRSNVYIIFDKPTLDTSVLMQISKLLDVDFFRYYSKEFVLQMSAKK